MSEIDAGDAPTLVGAVLGNYRITGALGAGGMGMVFRAQHELLGRQVAIKLLRRELTANSELVQRFFQEAKAASAIRHPGIIDVLDFGYSEEGRAYIVMEMLEGESLGTRLKRRGRLTEIETAQVTRGIASALTAAHGKHIIHRDLKPDNVFLVPDPDVPSGERPKVLDFGIAKLVGMSDGAVTQAGALMGTARYMAPEQAREAGTIDQRADLYSLGCMMYEMIVGEPPFVAQGDGEVIAMQMFTPAQSPNTRVERVSPQLNWLIMRLLEKDPLARCQSAAEVVEALAPITGVGFSGQFATTSPSRSMQRAHPPTPGGFGEPPVAARRSAMPVIAAVVTALLAGAGAAAFFITTRGAPEAQTADKPPEPATKPPESQPVKVNDTKPADTKVSDTKPADTKVSDTKPADTKVSDTKPANKPGDTDTKLKPTEGKPVDPKRPPVAVNARNQKAKPPVVESSSGPGPVISPTQVADPQPTLPTVPPPHPGDHVDSYPIEQTVDPPKKATIPP